MFCCAALDRKYHAPSSLVLQLLHTLTLNRPLRLEIISESRLTTELSKFASSFPSLPIKRLDFSKRMRWPLTRPGSAVHELPLLHSRVFVRWSDAQMLQVDNWSYTGRVSDSRCYVVTRPHMQRLICEHHHKQPCKPSSFIPVNNQQCSPTSLTTSAPLAGLHFLGSAVTTSHCLLPTLRLRNHVL